MNAKNIFHISENGNIKIFKPRASPSKFDKLNGDIVFGISYKLLHNYLFPRDCPRVTYYAKPESTPADIVRFFRTSAKFVVAVEAGWLPIIQQTTLYCYEFRGEGFTLLDECAGYYISYEQVKPISVKRIDNPLDELLKHRDIELLILPTLWNLADQSAGGYQ